jgi:hypothetical protein
MSESASSDAVKNRVFFMIGHAIMGTIIALVINFTGVFPVQPDLVAAPRNAHPNPVNPPPSVGENAPAGGTLRQLSP